jgi:hypothetical protein
MQDMVREDCEEEKYKNALLLYIMDINKSNFNLKNFNGLPMAFYKSYMLAG